ncbi:MAG: hypothetical protein KIT13_03995 [Burkholderiales bacterium]|nr:hypothetical protein [Burkholderiales bacterium]
MERLASGLARGGKALLSTGLPSSRQRPFPKLLPGQKSERFEHYLFFPSMLLARHCLRTEWIFLHFTAAKDRENSDFAMFKLAANSVVARTLLLSMKNISLHLLPIGALPRSSGGEERVPSATRAAATSRVAVRADLEPLMSGEIIPFWKELIASLVAVVAASDLIIFGTITYKSVT